MTHRQALLEIRSDLLQQALDLEIDVSLVAEQALRRKISERLTDEQRAEMKRKFQEENADAFAYWNEYVERNGLPLAKYRQF